MNGLTDPSGVLTMVEGADLADEADRLRWLDGRANTPRLVRFESTVGGDRLFIEPPLGRGALDHPGGLTPETLLRSYADALRSIHALPVDSCPFDCRRDQVIGAVRSRIASGAVGSDDLEPMVARLGPERFLAQVLAGAPDRAGESVVVHGAPRLANLVVGEDGVGGWTGLGLLGVGDRALDLACAARSIMGHLGVEAVAPFLDFYGGTPDLLLLDFYALLDQLR